MDKNIVLIPVSGIVVTYDRGTILRSTLESLANQNYQPIEIIVVDSSNDRYTYEMLTKPILGLRSRIKYYHSKLRGAASQRNYAVPFTSQEFLLFFDDDIFFLKECIQDLWMGINAQNNISGVNALISNQHYHDPGVITKLMYRLLSNSKLDSYAGKCIGPAWNLLPEDNDRLPTLVRVDWLNTTCLVYLSLFLIPTLLGIHLWRI
jgi:glycosyltransferase involved in cell wall biosynthesis